MENYKAAFIVHARDKGAYAYDSAKGALSQTYPCHILLSDQGSADNTFAEMERAVAEVPPGAEHKVELVHCPVEGKYGMAAMNAHIDWCVEQCHEEWIFESSADDYSLPDRVKVCMEEVARREMAAVATTMQFLDPLKPDVAMYSGEPKTSGFVKAGAGLWAMVYGSCAVGYSRKFLQKVGGAGDVTPDVYYGYLAALDKGYFAITNSLHVQRLLAAADNTGFGGRLRAATGDEVHRVNELNRFQLFNLYYQCAVRAQALYPLAHETDRNALIQMVLEQAAGWCLARKNLHDLGLTPGLM